MKKATILLLLFFGSTALASDWQIVVSADKMKTFIDKNSLARAGKYKKAWIQYSYELDQSGNVYSSYKNFRSMKQLEYFDCEERTSGAIQSAYYTAEYSAGDFLGGMLVKPQQITFSEVIPDTIGELILDNVCKPDVVKNTLIPKRSSRP